MGRLREFALLALENLAGPLNWQVVASGSYKTFTGYFLVYDHEGMTIMRVKGQIIEWQRLPAQVYLYDPPDFVKRHRHGSCLQLLRPNDRWFKLHFDHPAKDFASAYTYVEYFLTEAYNLSH
ncbi:MAG: hypothetical protein M3209_01040 [Acidobacteriota bacterium]|nr:hypothetical protein [Acidobacteriota bacterium]